MSFLRLGFGVAPEEADDAQVMRAAALVLRDVMTERGVESRMATRREEKRKVHYLSMEFLMGRALGNNIINLQAYKPVKEALDELGLDLNVIEDQEPDAALAILAYSGLLSSKGFPSASQLSGTSI